MPTDTFEVLADPTRREIVAALRDGEKTVSGIVDAVSIQQSGVSRHLRILHEAGFVEVRADGQHRYYALRGEPFQALDDWLAGYRALWDRRLDRFAGALAAKQKARAHANSETVSRKDKKEKKR